MRTAGHLGLLRGEEDLGREQGKKRIHPGREGETETGRCMWTEEETHRGGRERGEGEKAGRRGFQEEKKVLTIS